MRCIELPPPPVAASPSPAQTITTGGGRGWARVILAPARLTRQEPLGARDRAGQENSSGLRTSQVSLTLNLLAKNRLGVCKTPILLRKTALLVASIKLPGKPLPSSLRDDTVSPAGSGPAPQWGAPRTNRSGNGDRPLDNVPPARCGPLWGGKSRLPPWGSSHGIAVTEGVFTHSSLFTLHPSLSLFPPKKRKKREPPLPLFTPYHTATSPSQSPPGPGTPPRSPPG